MNSSLKRKTKSALKLMLDLMEEKEADVVHDYCECIDVVLYDMLHELAFEIGESEKMESLRAKEQGALVEECIAAARDGLFCIDRADREFLDEIDASLGKKERILSEEYTRLINIHQKIKRQARPPIL